GGYWMFILCTLSRPDIHVSSLQLGRLSTRADLLRYRSLFSRRREGIWHQDLAIVNRGRSRRTHLPYRA
ncbi:MAG: hypothetical protein ACP5O0_11455, partial [Acidimicrobiales bacterium]